MKRLAVNLAVLTLSLLVSLAGAEGLVRALGLFAEERAALEEAAPAADVGRNSEPATGMLIHPFLGWSRRPGPGRGGFGSLQRRYPDGKPPDWTPDFFTVNSFGFHSKIDDYRTVGDDRFVVGVFGGSVADQLVRFAGDVLAEEIGRRRPEVAGRTTVLNLGVGGYKQPQQTIALVEMLALGVRFDAVVNVDGLNEAAFGIKNVREGFHPVFPSIEHYKSNVALSTGLRSKELILTTAAVLRERDAARRIQDGGGVWRRSALVRAWLGWRVGVHERRAARREAELQAAAVEKEEVPLANLPAPCIGRPGHCRELIAGIWANCSRQMHDLARGAGAEYLHVLQPNQHVPGSKPMGEDERRVAGIDRAPLRRAVAEVYPLFQQQGERLRAEGVDFYDLTGIFAGHPEPLYVDSCCHMNVDGYRLLAEAVAARLVETPPPGN